MCAAFIRKFRESETGSWDAPAGLFLRPRGRAITAKARTSSVVRLVLLVGDSRKIRGGRNDLAGRLNAVPSALVCGFSTEEMGEVVEGEG